MAKKVLFLSHHFASPEIFLESILKMTPNRSGKFGNIEATLDVKTADHYAIFDGWPHQLPDMEHKALFFGEHPNTPYSPTDKCFEGSRALLKFPLRTYLNPMEWWINLDYSTLVNMPFPQKTKKLACVMTYQNHHPMYAARPKFMRAFINEYPEFDFDLYGRPSDKFLKDPILSKKYKGVLGVENYNALKGEHLIGKEILKDYEYTIEFDVGPCRNYLSERVADSILLYCYPFYYGCNNLMTYFPMGFKYIDINDTEQEPHKIMNAMLNDDRDTFMEELLEMRNLILNKYQLWGYVDFVVSNISDLITNQVETYNKWIEQ